MKFSTIIYTTSNQFAVITLNRPEVLNSLNQDMLNELKEALTLVKNDPEVRSVIITGSGRAFCTGQDLGEELPRDIPIESLVRERYNPIVASIREMPKPVIAAVNGVAAGAGASLALMCDIVLAGSRSVFIQAFSRIGLIPDCGGTYMLPRLIGLGRATAAMFLAEEIPAATALEWGMIYRVVSDEQLQTEAEQLAMALAQRPTKALALTKKLLNATFDQGLEKQLNAEAYAQQLAIGTEDFQEGIAAFKERRKPVFKGK